MPHTDLPVGFIAIHNPKRPGEYLVLHQRDFDSTRHVLFSEPLDDPGLDEIRDSDGDGVGDTPAVTIPPAPVDAWPFPTEAVVSKKSKKAPKA